MKTKILEREEGLPSWRPRWRREWTYSLLLFCGFLAVWEGAVRFFDISEVLFATPSATLFSLVQGLSVGLMARSSYFLHTFYTFGSALLGFILGSWAGIILAALLSQFPLLERLIYPYILAFQSLPKVALVPLVLTWVGLGLMSQVAIAMMLTFFPLLVNSLVGFRAVGENQLEMMRSFSSTKWQIFFKLRFPSALPFIFAGLEMSSILCVIGAIFAEFMGARRGLGTLILQMNFDFDIPGEFSIFVILSSLGLLFFALVRYLRRRVIFWSKTEEKVLGY